MEPLLLGIDIGTSACKAALFKPDGTVAAQANGEYPVYYPQEGWAEQNPEEWWTAVCKAVRALLEQDPSAAARIAGVGVDGQSWSAIPLGKDGACLCNTPIWMDTRAADICEELDRTLGADRIFEVCGNPLQPAYTLPKILWYQKHRPELYQKIDKILQSNSYIAYRLTDAVTQDLSQGYGLHCFDMRSGTWDRSLCREMGVRESLLPELVPSHAVVGAVTAAAAAQTGLREGTPVVAGGLDAACGALGAGVLHAGETQEQGGQAGGMSICLDQYCADSRLILGFHVVPDRWLLQGGTVGGGGVLRWFEAQFGAAERIAAQANGTSAFQELDRAAEKIPAGAEGLVFLPYMAGERSPIWDAKAKGVYYGLDFSKTRAHLARASLEGAAFSLRHNLETAAGVGARADILRAMGGAANSRLWTQIKADVTGCRIEVPSSDTATTLGAAMLAGVATGVYTSFGEAVKRTVQVKRVHTPDPAAQEQYAAAYQTYLELYERLSPLMRKGNQQ